MPVYTIEKKYLVWIVFCSLSFFACKKKADIIQPPPSADKAITSFVFKQTDNAAYLNADVTGLVGTDTIKIVVPAETDITSLKPAIVFTGKTISLADGAVQNFSSPVNYVVTAYDGSTKRYVVLANYRSTVFFSSLDGALYAFDALDGQPIWRLANGQFDSGTPSVYNGVVYANAKDGLYAVDARTGLQKWKYPIPPSASGGAPFRPSPVVAGNVVYVAAFDGFVYALNTADGTLKWRTASTAGGPFTSGVTLNNNLLYAGCADNYLYAFNAATGVLAWKTNTENPIYTNPLVVGNNICIQAFVKNWYLLNGSTGAVIWTSIGGDNISSPTLSNGRIYSGGGNRASALDANTGAQVWSFYFTPGGLVYNERPSPVINDGKFYSCSNDGKCYAYDIATKNLLWAFNTTEVNQAYIYASPVLSDGLLYFGNNNGVMYAINAATGAQVWRTGTSNGIFGSACVVDKNGVKHYPAVSGEQN